MARSKNIKADTTIKRIKYVTVSTAMKLLNTAHRQYVFQLIRNEKLDASTEKHQVGENPKQQRLITVKSITAFLKSRAAA
jgi:hypothetical protein